MLDNVVALLSNLGWMEYVERNCVSYDRLIIAFLSSLNVDWFGSYRVQEVLISFRMCNTNHMMSLREFNGLIYLPVYLESFRDVTSRCALTLSA